jgi:hypothetical protein
VLREKSKYAYGETNNSSCDTAERRVPLQIAGGNDATRKNMLETRLCREDQL